MCNERKDITAFNVVKAKTKDGYGEYANSYCKPCTSIRYKMARIRWQQNNPDKIKGYNYTKMNKHKIHPTNTIIKLERARQVLALISD